MKSLQTVANKGLLDREGLLNTALRELRVPYRPPERSPGAARLRAVGGLRGKLNMAPGLTGVHLENAELNFGIAFRPFRKLLALDAGTDLVQTVFRQDNSITGTGQVIRALTVPVLACRCNIRQQLPCPKGGGALRSDFLPGMAQCSIPVGRVTLLQSLISPCA